MRLNRYYPLDIYKMRDMKANYHTHTKRCKHAEGEDREYVEAAIRAGFSILGFADHTPYPFGEAYSSPIRMEMSELEDYVDSILSMKKEYEKDIQILLGLEVEYFPEYFKALMSELHRYPFDYLVLGQHYFDSELTRKNVKKARNEEEFLIKYVDQVIEGIHTGYFAYLAHPDIINYIGDKGIYLKHMRRLALEMKHCDIPLEINVNGYRDGCNYPNEPFLDLAVEIGNDFIIGVDAHAPWELQDIENYNRCVELVRSRGGKLLSV